MRRGRVLAAFCSIGAAVVIAACGADDASTTESNDAGSELGDATADSTGPSSGDASAPLDAASHRDGSVSDAGVDAGPPGLVTVHAIDAIPFNGTVPVVGAVVVFYDPDGTPHVPLMTDDAGAASAVVSPGSAVTVSMTNDAGYPVLRELVSILAIEPGDDLIANGSQTTYSRTSTAVVTLDPPVGDGGAGNEEWTIGCGDHEKVYGTSATFGADQNCIVAQSVSAMAWAKDDPVYVNKVSAFAVAQNVSVADGGAEISDWGWTPAIPTPVAVIGTFPPSSDSLGVSAVLRSGSIIYGYDQNASSPVVDGGITDPSGLAFGLPPPGFIDNIIYEASVGRSGADPNAFADLLTVGTYADGFGVNLDDLPPLLSNGTASFDATSRIATFGWSSDGPLANLDGEIVVLGWNVVKASTYLQYSWTIIAPPGTSLVSPALTPDLIPDLDLPPPPSPYVTHSVLIQGFNPLHGYARYRAHYGDYSSGDFVTNDPYPTTPVRLRRTALYY